MPAQLRPGYVAPQLNCVRTASPEISNASNSGNLGGILMS